MENKLDNLKIVLFTSMCPVGLVSPDSMSVPLGLYTLKTMLEENGAQCEVCDFDLQTEESYIKKIVIVRNRSGFLCVCTI